MNEMIRGTQRVFPHPSFHAEVSLTAHSIFTVSICKPKAADEINTDDESLRAGLQEVDQLGEVRGLLGLDHHSQGLVGKDSSQAANHF